MALKRRAKDKRMSRKQLGETQEKKRTKCGEKPKHGFLEFMVELR